VKLSRGEKTVVVLVAVLGVIGFGLSFANVAAELRPSFGDLAPAVPLGIDVGIAAFTGLDLAMAKRNMRTRWLRLFPWLLIGTTVYLNVGRESDLYGKVAHGVLPLLFVVLVEAGAHVIRVLADLAGEGSERMDRVRFSRWLLAPWPTLRLWRRMVLWEVTSYSEALRREQDRLLALCDLQDANGGPLRWRWRASRRERALYKLGRLSPGVMAPAIAVALEPVTGSNPVTEAIEHVTTPKLNGDLDAAVQTWAADLKAGGGRVTKRAVQDQFHVGSEKAADLARRYR
jgi:hypothetical protein